MKYRLKKDLPKYKAGTEFRITNKGHLATGDTVVYQKNELEKYPSILTEWFEEIQEQPKTVWGLKTGDKCWKIDGAWKKGYTGIFFSDYAEALRELGDLFMTEEEAKQEVARRKAKVILERDAKGFKPNWKDRNQAKYYVLYAYGGTELSYNLTYSVNEGLIYFATWKDAEASIKAHQNEWKTYLGVEE